MTDLKIAPDIAGMNLFLTRNCNLRCTYCFVDKSDAHDLTEEISKQAVSFIAACARNSTRRMHVGYIGGEPMLKWGLFKQVTQRLRSLDQPIDIGFTTNGTLLNDSRVQFILENNIRVVLSFDGDPFTMQDRLTANGKPSYPLVRHGVELLHQHGVPFLIQLTVTPQSAPRFFHNVRHLAEMGATRIIFGYVLEANWDKTSADALATNLTQIFSFYEDVYRHNYDFTLKYVHDEVLSYLLTRSGRPRIAQACPMGREVFAVDVDGSIYPCQAFVNYPEWRIGHVSTGFDHAVRALVSNVCNDQMTPCQSCKLLTFCRKCPRSNYLINRDPYQVDGFSCFLGRTTYALVEDFVETMVREQNPRFMNEVGDLIEKWELSFV